MNNMPTNPEEFKQALGELARWHQNQAFLASQRNDKAAYEFHVRAGFICQVGAVWTPRGMATAPPPPWGPGPEIPVSPNDQGYVYGTPAYPPGGGIRYGVPRGSR